MTGVTGAPPLQALPVTPRVTPVHCAQCQSRLDTVPHSALTPRLVSVGSAAVPPEGHSPRLRLPAERVLFLILSETSKAISDCARCQPQVPDSCSPLGRLSRPLSPAPVKTDLASISRGSPRAAEGTGMEFPVLEDHGK